MTNGKSILAVAALLVATNQAGTAFAGADDYAFEPVNAQIKSSATFAKRDLRGKVRLVPARRINPQNVGPKTGQKAGRIRAS